MACSLTFGAPGQLSAGGAGTRPDHHISGHGSLTQAVLDSSLDGAFVAGPIDHPDLMTTSVFKEELVLLSARRWKSLAALRAGTPASGPTMLVFRPGCFYRKRLQPLLSYFGAKCGPHQVWNARCHHGMCGGRYGRDSSSSRSRRA